MSHQYIRLCTYSLDASHLISKQAGTKTESSYANGPTPSTKHPAFGILKQADTNQPCKMKLAVN